ncbi:hypothetical protein EI42_04172 [Thermosporothrix hazakensis]|uniref:Uncharacterized protein n=2 Tax=Thermosporothrix hazakensis TaxID=644383 RepID=A0A326UFK1_THEHA|nr:hypothetical protein [Thermosporothrix hazakensis]PZW25679.1 hypothetical protein EI42_04172 [Thermosporothrix hazakensis]GCE48174.1 hypothetical protein KTH_30430 [Thermosporothrix hazakensis]
MSGRMTKVGVLALIGCLFLVLFSACNVTQVPTHKIYEYGSIESLPKDRLIKQKNAFTYRPGDEIMLTWKPQATGETMDKAPQKVSIEAGLIGPFPSLDELNKAVSFDRSSMTGPVATTMTPVQTDNWTDTAVSTKLKLPSSLKSGYYMLVQRILTAGRGPKTPIPTGSVIYVP